MPVQIGDVVFDDDSRQVRRAGEVLHLTPKAFQLLQILVAGRPKAISREELMQRVWPDVVVEEANLKNLVSEIRAALGGAEIIRTVRGFGYALAAPRPAATKAALKTKDRFYELREGENVIGRSHHCAVVLEAVGVSREHARIVLKGVEAVLEDLASKNGTFLNGDRIATRSSLKSGDEIGVGVTTLTFRIFSQEETTATVERSERT